MNKVTTMQKAVAENIHDGNFVYIGGYICRTPFSAVHELIRQGKKDLTITRSNAADVNVGETLVWNFLAEFVANV